MARSSLTCGMLVVMTALVPLVASAQPVRDDRLAGLWSAGFVPNVGQFPEGVDYVYRGPGSTLVLAGGAATVLGGDGGGVELSVRLEGAQQVAPVGRSSRRARSHHFVGRDSRDWHVDVPYLGQVEYGDLRPGVDLIVTAGAGGATLRLIAGRGDDIGDLVLDVQGTGVARALSDGSIVLGTGNRATIMAAPVTVGGSRPGTVGRFVSDASGVASRARRSDGRSRERVRVDLPAAGDDAGGIDIALRFPSSPGDGFAYAAAIDGSDQLYVAGFTTALVTTPGVPQPGFGGGTRDAFVAKFDPAGQLVYASYLGGVAGDEGRAIGVDAGGNAYVGGFTASANFPVAAAVQPGFGGGTHDAFVAKLDASGSRLLFSTYLGGRQPDFGEGLAVDASGAVLLVGSTASLDFPLVGSLQAPDGLADAFLAKIRADGTTLEFSTVLGGSQCDAAWSVAVDAAGVAYLTGQTNSADFPLSRPVQGSFGGGVPACNGAFGGDAFVAAIDVGASRLGFSTFLGGSSGDIGNGIAVDERGIALVTGRTDSADFPTVRPLQPNHGGGAGGSLLGGDAFVARLDTRAAAIVHSTFLGGSQGEAGYGVAIDESGNAYVAGFSVSSNFPVQSAPQPFNGGGRDVFVAKLDPAGQQLLYSTYAGGAADDAALGLVIDRGRRAFFAGYAGGSATLGTVPLVTLSVTLAGSGTGRVTSSPSGVECGSDCVESYGAGSTVTLVAHADMGSRFIGWSGNPACGQSVLLGPDVACVATFDQVMPSDGTGQLPTGETYTLDGRTRVTRGPWPQAWTARATDFNGDDLVDLFMYNRETGSWQQALNDGQGRFVTTVGAWSPGWEVSLLDLDGDTRPDVFVYAPTTGDWYRCLSAVPAGFQCTGGGQWSPGWEIHVARHDLDGYDDLFLYNRATGGWYWAINDRAAGFTFVGGAWSPGWSVSPADMTGDGRTDLVLFDAASGDWYVAVNAGAVFAYVSGRWSPGWSIVPLDLDGNGVSDVLVYDPVTGAWFECLYDGLGGFAYAGGRWSPGWEVLAVDIDRDGRDDLFFYDRASGDWFEGLNVGLGAFAFTGGRWSPGLTLVVPTG